MFNVGGPEIVIIIIIALLVLGPDQLPKAMRTMGNAMAQVNKVKGGLQAEMNKAMSAVENATKAEPEVASKAGSTATATAPTPSSTTSAAPASGDVDHRAADRASS